MKINKQPGVTTGNGTFTVREGGVSDLTFIRTSMIDQPNGVPLSTENNLLNPAHIDLTAAYYKVSLNGPSKIRQGIESVWQITNVNLTQEYVSSTTDGTVTVRDGLVKFTSSNVGFVKFKIDNREFTVECTDEAVQRPTITPITNPWGRKTISLTSSDFVALNITDTHDYSEWEMSYDPSFATIIEESRNVPEHKQSWSLVDLQLDKVYYVRVRYKGAILPDFSDWSAPLRIETAKRATVLVSKPVVTYPTANANNVIVRPTMLATPFALNNWEDTHQKSEWQIANDAAFANIVRTTGETTDSLTFWATPMLPINNVLYIRVRYAGTDFPWSEWSTPVVFRTENLSIIKPEITFPSNGAIRVPFGLTLTSTTFNKIGSINHEGSSWQISSNAGFSTIVRETVFDPNAKTSWSVTGLSPNTTYYARVKHMSIDSIESDWSNITTFVTEELRVNTPTVASPVNGSTNVSIDTQIITTAFGSNFGFTHKDSDWQLSANETFTALIATSNNDATNKTTWRPGRLNVSTTYYVRVRHRSNTDLTSGWSPVASFTTGFMAVRKPSILTPPNNSQDYGLMLSATSSAFEQEGGLTHTGSTWQMSTTASFSNVVDSVIASADNKLTWSSSRMEPSTEYFIRVKYHSNQSVDSEWSDTITLRTINAKVVTPTVTTPGTDQALPYGNTTFVTAAFNSIGGLSHSNTEWEIATDANFTNVVASTDTSNTGNPLTWTVNVA